MGRRVVAGFEAHLGPANVEERHPPREVPASALSLIIIIILLGSQLV